MFKMSKPVLYLLLATVAIAIYLVATPSSPSSKKSSTALAKPQVSVSSSQYTDEDRKANFPKAILASRDAFQPIVVRKSSINAILAAAGNIPADFADGDPNWSCTGTDEVNGVQQALVENKNTGDGDFLQQGDHWKSCVVSQVLDDGVVLVGPGGEAKTVHVKQDTTDTGDLTDLSGNIPVEPQLSGAIGGPNAGGSVVQTQSTPAANTPALPAPTPETTSTTTTTDDNNGG